MLLSYLHTQIKIYLFLLIPFNLAGAWNSSVKKQRVKQCCMKNFAESALIPEKGVWKSLWNTCTIKSCLNVFQIMLPASLIISPLSLMTSSPKLYSAVIIKQTKRARIACRSISAAETCMKITRNNRRFYNWALVHPWLCQLKNRFLLDCSWRKVVRGRHSELFYFLVLFHAHKAEQNLFKFSLELYLPVPFSKNRSGLITPLISLFIRWLLP